MVSKNKDVSEQGRIQGALYSVQALAAGVGPAVLRFVQSKTMDSPLGPGFMFVFAGALYLVAVAIACALPKERTNSNRDNDEDLDSDYYLLLSEDNDNCIARSDPGQIMDEETSASLS
jgi:hypothetical protein